MSRLRVNNQSDVTSGRLTFTTGGTTTGTWTVAPGFPTIVAPDFYVIVVEPDTPNEEIVFLTAYTAGATTGTFTRAQEGTAGVAHTQARWIHGPTAADYKSAVTRVSANSIFR